MVAELAADAPLAGAVRTPLDLWSLRQVYVGTGADPGKLTDRSRFPAAADITRHLLDHLVGALLGTSPPGRRCWDAEDAARWLSWPVHQFRHAEVHDHLARAEVVSGADRSPNPLP
ncbi:hypothetical protein [Saccharopolyspora sp. CA-218241]|uniref:hypothetical protein n=1 Tax=Saccharopolyspora sp. CA-218241 TaxID=3240027 RepID=UPI003D997222